MHDWIDDNFGAVCFAVVIVGFAIMAAVMIMDATNGAEAARACRVTGGVLVRMDEGEVCAGAEVIE